MPYNWFQVSNLLLREASPMSQQFFFKAFLFCLVILQFVNPLIADTFTYLNREGKAVTIEARLAGSGKLIPTNPECFALEMANGTIRIIPQGLITKRVPGKDPEPVSHKEMAKEMQQTFPNRRLLIQIAKPYVIGMVLSDEKHGKRALKLRKKQLKKSGRYFLSVQKKFLRFIRKTHVKTESIKYPLPVLIFEDDSDFEQYATLITQRKGLSAKNIAGFYDAGRNYLNLRIRECKTFETPLHEAIHQQTFNRKVLQRLAPVPAWFVEGIACGFEGDGENIRSGPRTPRRSYAKVSLQARAVDWKEVIQRDRAFRGDIFAGEAYGHAWGLHWILVTRHKKKYAKYLKLLSTKKTLEVYSAEDRLKDFEEIMGANTNKLQRQFQKNVIFALNKRRN